MIKKLTGYRLQATVLILCFILIALFLLPPNAYRLMPALAQTAACPTQSSNPRVTDGLISASSISDNKFSNNTGTCVVDPNKAPFVPYEIPTYDDLKSLYFDQSKADKVPLTGDKTQADINLSVASAPSSENWLAETWHNILDILKNIFPKKVFATTGPIGWWKFDEGSGTTTTDSSGFGHNGTVYGAAWTTGHTGGALEFDGSDTSVDPADGDGPDYVDLGSGAGLNPGNFTITMWGKVADNPAGKDIWRRLIAGTNYGIAYPAQDSPDVNDYSITARVGAGTTYQTPANSLPPDTWKHVATTYDGSTLQIYINGALQTTTTPGWPLGLSGNLTIGNRNTSGGDKDKGVKGVIDDVRIYDRVLTSAEIQDIYNPPAPSPSESGKIYHITGDLTINSNITVGQTGIIFVDGNLSINTNLTHSNNNAGLVFVVKGDAIIDKSVTQVDAIIISSGTIYTAGAGCSHNPPGVSASQLVINGSLISLSDTNNIEFCRTLANNATSAEKINYQPKYLVILRNLFSDTLQKWSEIQ